MHGHKARDRAEEISVPFFSRGLGLFLLLWLLLFLCSQRVRISGFSSRCPRPVVVNGDRVKDGFVSGLCHGQMAMGEARGGQKDRSDCGGDEIFHWVWRKREELNECIVSTEHS